MTATKAEFCSKGVRLIAGTVPGIERRPRRKSHLTKLLYRWRDEATGKGCTVMRIAVALEAGSGVAKPTGSR